MFVLVLLEGRGGGGDWGFSSNENISYANIIIHKNVLSVVLNKIKHPKSRVL